MISKKDTLSFYKNPIVQQIIFEESRNKEISFRYGETFGKRPNTISSPKELIVEASKGMTSIHVSEQTWFNPLDVKGTQEGWDLILDIDCKVFEYAKITTDIIVKYLKFLGCECFVKFSGNKGFHIAVPYEYFPRIINGKPLKEMFPYAPRKIATFIQEKTKLNSFLFSDKNGAPGHRLRHEIAGKFSGFDKFGKGARKHLKTKTTALKDYMFSITVENTKEDYWFTEKILDCFAVGTIPIYWGCPSIGDFFDTNGILIFDNIDELESILNNLTPELYYDKLESVKINYEKSKRYWIADDLIYSYLKESNLKMENI